MHKYLMEFIGTFFLVFAIAMSTTVGGAGAMASLAIGLMLAVMVYAGGHVSGAHYNPAVTLAVTLRGKCDLKDVPGYVGAQIAGAAGAAAIASYLGSDFFGPGGPGMIGISEQVTLVQALLVEALCTFALAFVVLNVATAKGTEGNYIYGLAIGLTVTTCAYLGGAVSGGAFNPAVYFGPTIVGLIKGVDGAFAHSILYAAGPLAGGALAAVVFKITNPGDTA